MDVVFDIREEQSKEQEKDLGEAVNTRVGEQRKEAVVIRVILILIREEGGNLNPDLPQFDV